MKKYIVLNLQLLLICNSIFASNPNKKETENTATAFAQKVATAAADATAARSATPAATAAPYIKKRVTHAATICTLPDGSIDFEIFTPTENPNFHRVFKKNRPESPEPTIFFEATKYKSVQLSQGKNPKVTEFYNKTQTILQEFVAKNKNEKLVRGFLIYNDGTAAEKNIG